MSCYKVFRGIASKMPQRQKLEKRAKRNTRSTLPTVLLGATTHYGSIPSSLPQRACVGLVMEDILSNDREAKVKPATVVVRTRMKIK